MRPLSVTARVLAALATAGIAAVPASEVNSNTLDLRGMPARVPMKDIDLLPVQSSSSGPSPFNVRAKDGWSVREGQRRARKRRNKARHRAACRR